MDNCSIVATIRVLVDGGANHWLKFITENKLIDSIEKPHFSTGDMDSISDESKQRLQTMNCQQIETPDQDEPDCPKSLIAIRPHLETRNVNKFIYSNYLIVSSLEFIFSDKIHTNFDGFWRPN